MAPDELTTPASAGSDVPPPGPRQPADGAHPPIGSPSAPPPALVVAVSGNLNRITRGVRWRQFFVNALGIALGTSLAAGAALGASAYAQSGRAVAFAEAAILGLLLVLGVILNKRPLELGTGALSRRKQGGIEVGTSIKGLLLLVPGTFREAAEGLIYALGLMKVDPATELAAWLMLALLPPHGPPAGTWVSLGGISSAGPFSLPEDLKAATRALTSVGCVEANKSVYPPLVRMTSTGAQFIKDLLGKGR